MNNTFKVGDKVRYENWDYIVSDILEDPDRPNDPLVRLEPIQTSIMYRSASELTLLK